MSTLAQCLRGLLFFILTLFGMLMALTFMVCTALAVGVLYVLARIQGRPFGGVRNYWSVRRPQPFFAASSRTRARPAHQDVMDVEMREVG